MSDSYEDDPSFMFDDLPGVDGSCRLLGPTALVVQGLMGVLVLLSLLYKRQRETPKRPWRIWLFDVSKQVVGQMFVHGLNVLISDMVARLESGNACVLYFLNILIDTTLGVATIYLILHVSTYLLTEKLGLKGFESGQYGTPPRFRYWLQQAVVYVICLSIMKLLVVCLFALFPGLVKIGAWLLSWTRMKNGKEYLQVIFTMGIFPITMNVLQFWLIDSIVKASSSEAADLLPDGLENEPDREPLFNHSDDEDDDDDDAQRHDIENPPPSRNNHQEASQILQTSDADGKPPPSITPSHESKNSSAGVPINNTAHSYPPSLSSSASSSLSHSAASSVSSKRELLRKTKPQPLALKITSQPAINSPSPSNLPSKPKAQPQLAARSSESTEDSGDEWAAWGDDDWANKVGEEEWTGTRLGITKGEVDTVWASPGRHKLD